MCTGALHPACARPADGAGSAQPLATVAVTVGALVPAPQSGELLQVARRDPSWGQREPPLRHAHVDAATAATTGRSLGQPDPALRCRQVGISADALRACATTRERLRSRLPSPGRLSGLGRAERRRWAIPPLRRRRVCAMSASRHRGTRCARAVTAERVTVRRPPVHVQARFTGSLHVCSRHGLAAAKAVAR